MNYSCEVINCGTYVKVDVLIPGEYIIKELKREGKIRDKLFNWKDTSKICTIAERMIKDNLMPNDNYDGIEGQWKMDNGGNIRYFFFIHGTKEWSISRINNKIFAAVSFLVARVEEVLGVRHIIDILNSC